LVLLGAGLVLALACAPRPAHRELPPGLADASDEDDAGGTGGEERDDGAAAGGSGNAGELLDAAPDESPPEPDVALDLAGPSDVGVPDLPHDLPPPDRDSGADLPAGVDLTAGLIHHWKLDEGMGMTAVDTVKGNNGTRSGGGLPAWTPGGAPIPGNQFSLTFDGVDDYLALKENLAPELGVTATLSCWIKTTQKGADNSWDAPGITGVEQSGGSDDIFWGFLDASGNIGLRPGSGRTVKSAAPVNDNMWHNIVMTRDKTSGRIEMFVDGKLAKADDGMQTDEKKTPFSSLARITNSSKPYFKGQLDDIRVWDRVLSPAEVAAVFAGN
jgi:hypothetical protein